MGWNGSGSVTLSYDFTADRDAGPPSDTISAEKFDTLLNDMAAAIEATLNRNGENAMAANVSWGGFRLTSLGAATAGTDAIRARQVAENTVQYGGTTAGSANAYTCSNTFLSSVATGTRLLLKASFTNSGPTTLNVNAGGATAVVLADGATALSGGEIVSGDFIEVVYDGTSWCLIHSSAQLVFGTALTPIAADGASLGTSALPFSDVFLAAGGVINWNAGTITITESSGALLFDGGDVYIRDTGGPVSLGLSRLDTHGPGSITSRLYFNGKSSAGTSRVYAEIAGYANVDTDAAEQGDLIFYLMKAGTLTQLMQLNIARLFPVTNDALALGSGTLSWSDLFLASGAVVNFNNGDVTITHSANALAFAGASSGYTFDSDVTITGAMKASASVLPVTNDTGALGSSTLGWSDLYLASGAIVYIDNSAHITFAGTTIEISKTVFFASQNPAFSTTAGWSLLNTGVGQVAASSTTPFYVNRITNDGTLLDWRRGGASVGTVSVSGGVITYGTFCGNHWSQLEDASKREIKRGTVIDTIDEMSVLDEGESQTLPRFKVSSTFMSDRVYGVFMDWDVDAYADRNVARIASLGAFVVRVAADERVKAGDLLVSDGEGCAVRQESKIVCTHTICKVTSSKIVETYDDGSYLVPCVLYCG